MSSGNTAPVIAGLAVGIVLIFLFASFTKPDFPMSDEEIKQKSGNLPEVQALKERYNEVSEEIRREGSTAYIEYSITKTWLYNPDPSRIADAVGSTVLLLTISVDRAGATSMELYCSSTAGRSYVVFPATVGEIRTSDCLG